MSPVMSGTMIRLAVIRHAPTRWNAQGRLQGRKDLPVSDAGEKLFSSLKPPPVLDSMVWRSSPLLRARQTAALLGHPDAQTAAELTEMDWGRWEGRTLKELRDANPSAMAENESRGRHFRPDGGESPAEVQQRVMPFLKTLAAAGRDSVAVTHKGIIRAMASLALDWDMTQSCPVRLESQAVHFFRLDGAGCLHPDTFNVALIDRRTAGESS